MILAGDINQRFGQLVWNAVADDLTSSDRVVCDDDVAKALFYMSDDHLNAIIERYISVHEARTGTKRVGDAVPSDDSDS